MSKTTEREFWQRSGQWSETVTRWGCMAIRCRGIRTLTSRTSRTTRSAPYWWFDGTQSAMMRTPGLFAERPAKWHFQHWLDRNHRVRNPFGLVAIEWFPLVEWFSLVERFSSVLALTTHLVRIEQLLRRFSSAKKVEKWKIRWKKLKKHRESAERTSRERKNTDRTESVRNHRNYFQTQRVSMLVKQIIV